MYEEVKLKISSRVRRRRGSKASLRVVVEGAAGRRLQFKLCVRGNRQVQKLTTPKRPPLTAPEQPHGNLEEEGVD